MADFIVSVDPLDIVKIILLAFLTNCLSELLSFVLIYRKREYINLKKQIDSLNKRVEAAKESLTVGGKTEKKVNKNEAELRVLNMEMMRMRMLSHVIIAMFMIFSVSLFSSIYNGIVVAKLPFIPFAPIYALSHRNLLSKDPTDCSFIFLYVLSNLAIRPVLQKVLGVAGPRSFTAFHNYFGKRFNYA